MNTILLEIGSYQMVQTYHQQVTHNHYSTLLILGYQTVGLSITNGPELPTGIYYCEIMDRNNVTHYLYAGIYPESEGIKLIVCA